MGNSVTVTPNSGSLQVVLTIGLPVEKFGVSVQSLMRVGRLKAVFFSLLSHSISREHVRRDPGVTP